MPTVPKQSAGKRVYVAPHHIGHGCDFRQLISPSVVSRMPDLIYPIKDRVQMTIEHAMRITDHTDRPSTPFYLPGSFLLLDR